MKNVLKSKVVWFNVLTVLTVIASIFGYVPDKDVADTATGVLLAMSPFVNLILRFFTSQPISFGTEDK